MLTKFKDRVLSQFNEVCPPMVGAGSKALIRDFISKVIQEIEEAVGEENKYTDGGHSYGVGYNEHRNQFIRKLNN